MATTQATKSKPHINIGTLGHRGHGKTTLTAAITKVLADKFPSLNKAVSVAEIDKRQEERRSGQSVCTTHVEYQTEKRHYAHSDCPGDIHYVKNMISGASQMDGAILVVSAADGPQKQTREDAVLARSVGVESLVVALSKCDLVDSDEVLELVETEVREMLSDVGFEGDTVPVRRVSALRALDGQKDQTTAVLNLMNEVDSAIPIPKRAVDKPFLLAVDEVFDLGGRGVVATGRVETGVIKPGDAVDIVGLRETQKSTVTGIEEFKKQLDKAEAGRTVGLLLRGIQKGQIERGQVVAAPNTVTPHTLFEAKIYMLSKDEGGRPKPFFNGYRPQFYFRTMDVTGEMKLRTDGDDNMVMPGDRCDLSVALMAPIEMERAQSFAIREGGKTIGVGRVTKILA
ncbi:elongation factor Tu [Streptomyces piniterrae]|uniref:Elongation factor Tu n=1 Tax=Streptomyces piniterrae TaxID=2571125 RepID=A0A4U0NV06_9ACTN|nr:elongation factor Tu [Streptomyces piniterrae]TJZ54084.1 elongation factor Tu [Streptomyces piniterrae]